MTRPFLVNVALGVGLLTSRVGMVTRADQPAEKPVKLNAPGIENAFRLSARLYSGGEPQGDQAFEVLKSLGVKTMITVDGARPDIARAHKYGMRYVHIPVGYDGVPRDQAIRLVQAVKSLPGPVFVHCHHGKHRGPTAAALCAIASEAWTKERALAWLKTATTSPDYRGLFASVNDFTLPTGEELARVGDDFPEEAKVETLVEAMTAIDKRWDHLKAIQEAGHRPPADAPDLDPPHEALQLAEELSELLRLDATKARGTRFEDKMRAAERAAVALQEGLRGYASASPETKKVVDAMFVAVGKSCSACHADFRDNRSDRRPAR